MEAVKVGLLGLGTVGGGTVSVLSRNAEEIARRAGRGIQITHAAAKEYNADAIPGIDNIKTISDKEIRGGQGPQLLKNYVSTFDTIYSSFDLDVLDPAFAPGVGNPEAVGISSRELFDMIHSFEETKIIGVDIVEFNPYHDNGSTASLAAKIMSTMIAMNLSKNK